MSKKCVKCGAEFADADLFCGECGTKQPQAATHCSNCGEELPSNSKFCPNCGTPVNGASVSVEVKPSSAYPDCIITEPDADTICINVKGVKFNMKLIEGGMLDKYTELSDFYIGETVVTQELWQMVMGDNPSEDNSNLQLPITNINSTDCTAFMLKLKALTGKEFVLPTVYQWKFAYKGGNKSRNYKFAGGNNLNKVAWTEDNSDEKLHPVGMLYPNELGLCDMEGNVHELVQGKYTRGSSYRFNPDCEEDESYVSSSALCEYGEDDEEGSFTGMRLSINIPVSQVDIDEKYQRVEEEKRKAEEEEKCKAEAAKAEAMRKAEETEKAARRLAEEQVQARAQEEAERKNREEEEQKAKKARKIQMAKNLKEFQSGEKDKRLLVSCYNGKVFSGFKSQYKSKIIEYTIPTGYEEIGQNAFEGCDNLIKIVIPEGITRIGKRAFMGCNKLPEVILPNDVEEIGEEVFRYCRKLTKMELPHGLASIPAQCFSNCENLSSIIIPESVIKICKEAFSGCSSLKSMKLPDSITHIGDRAFAWCEQLKIERLPERIKILGDNVFERMDVSFIVLPDSIVQIGRMGHEIELHLKMADPSRIEYTTPCYPYFSRIHIPRGTLALYKKHPDFRSQILIEE